jgi:hypothetical protein
MLEKVPIQRCNFQLGLYAVHLATGHAISCRAVKAKTIEKYLRNVSAFCARSNPRDPRKSEQTNKALAPAIQGVLDEVKRWENIPERREPFTIEMLRYLIELRDSLPHIHGQDSCLAAMVEDWATDGLYDGFRLSEWPSLRGTTHCTTLNSTSRGVSKLSALRTLSFLHTKRFESPPQKSYT